MKCNFCERRLPPKSRDLFCDRVCQALWENGEDRVFGRFQRNARTKRGIATRTRNAIKKVAIA